MNSGSRHSFRPQWLALGLAMLLGQHGIAQATPSAKQAMEGKQDTTSISPAPSKEEATSEDNQDVTSKKSTAQNEEKMLENDEEDRILDEEEEDEFPKKPRLRKPKLLEPVKLAQEDPLASLDKLIVKKQVPLAPYVPLVQTIDVAFDYDKIAWTLWKRKEQSFAVNVSILWRKNIQLSGTWGYNQLRPALVKGNIEAYTVQGQYGTVGLAYFVKYNLYNNLYAGLLYGRSYFKNSTVPTPDVQQVISKDLTASWLEFVIGSEQQLLKNSGIYAGLILHLKGFGSFEPFERATNYVVPGYGRSVSRIVPSISFYIKYQILFLKKQISFSAPKIN
ncbi:MAG: DUF6048 family protein [Bacteroidota bacterium]